MSKIFKQESGAIDNGVVAMLMILVTSLTFSSIAISWFLLQIYGVSVSGIALPSFEGGQTQDFLSNSYDKNVLVYGGDWNYIPNIGRQSTSSNSFIVFDNVLSNNNQVYTNTYTINNTGKSDYSILLEYSQNGYTEVITKSDGFYYHVYSSVAIVHDVNRFFTYPNANQLQRVTIETEYNPTKQDGSGLVYKINGETVIDIPWYNLVGAQSGLQKVYYGGIGSKSIGLILERFDSTNDRNEDGLAAFLTGGIAFISTLLHIVVYNVDPIYLPWEINAIFIKTQVFGVVGCAFVYWRG